MGELADSTELTGAWKLNYFCNLNGEKTRNIRDILIFAGSYYSDFHVEGNEQKVVDCHVGMFKLTGNSITFNIQLSTSPESIGRVATGTYQVMNDNLQIAFSHGRRPGVWIYSRLK